VRPRWPCQRAARPSSPRRSASGDLTRGGGVSRLHAGAADEDPGSDRGVPGSLPDARGSTILSHRVAPSAPAAGSSGPSRRISFATGEGTTMSGPASWRRSRRRARARKMSGEALTANVSAKAQFAHQVVEVDHERVRTRARELQEELASDSGRRPVRPSPGRPRHARTRGWPPHDGALGRTPPGTAGGPRTRRRETAASPSSWADLVREPSRTGIMRTSRGVDARGPSA
jgi:hypothetical protein